MTTDSLVSINVYERSTNKILNKSLVPLLFYWNGEGDLMNSIFSNKKFKEEYLSFSSYKDYLNLNISYFYFILTDENEEKYVDYNIELHKNLHFTDLDNDDVVIDLISSKMLDLYRKSVKKDFIDIKLEKINIIKQIYINLKSLFSERIQKPTLINYIRSEIIKEGFDSVNEHYAINLLTNILQ